MTVDLVRDAGINRVDYSAVAANGGYTGCDCSILIDCPTAGMGRKRLQQLHSLAKLLRIHIDISLGSAYVTMPRQLC